MIRNLGRYTIPSMALLATLVAPALSQAQMFSLSKEELIEYTAANPFDRFPDGRPKIPDSIIERAKGISSEEVFAVLPGKRFMNQYADGFQMMHTDKKMVGRAFTVQFMPLRPDVDTVLTKKAQAKGARQLNNQFAFDMLQPGDVLVVDLFGKKEGGTIVGDNLFYYIMKTTKGAGMVVDGAIRDADGISDMNMPLYYRGADPSFLTQAMVTGINIPVRIGGVTVMPGDLVVGDREGVYFIPPQFAKEVMDNADVVHVHDEWTRKKFDEGKYKSSDIYSSPRDPALRQEYQDYLKKRLEEIRKQQPQ